MHLPLPFYPRTRLGDGETWTDKVGLSFIELQKILSQVSLKTPSVPRQGYTKDKFGL